MSLEQIEKFIYGNWRPWINGGPENLLSSYKKSEEANSSEDSVDWWHRVHEKEPYDRLSLAYQQMILRSITESYNRFLRELQELDKKLDQRYLYVTYVRNLKSLLVDTDKQKEDGKEITGYVLHCLRLQLVNAIVDVSLKYGELAPDYKYDVEQIYLNTLDRRPPSPSPFYFTVHWFENELCELLSAMAKNKISHKKMTAFLNMLTDRMASLESSSSIWVTMDAVRRHAENGLFLILFGSSFLEKQGYRICDADFCREWIISTKADILKKGNDEDLRDKITELQQVRSEFLNLVQPVEAAFTDASLSEARAWMDQLETAWNPAEKQTEDTGDSEGKGTKKFVDFFHNRFVHKKEVERALEVHGRTLESYLEGREVRRLKLKANEWFVRDDLEAFLEDSLTA